MDNLNTRIQLNLIQFNLIFIPTLMYDIVILFSLVLVKQDEVF